MNTTHTHSLNGADDAATLAALLRRAAALVERHGWLQFDLWPGAIRDYRDYIEGDPCCALGALAVAHGRADCYGAQRALYADPMLRAATDALADWIHDEVESWNDADGQTAGQVIAALHQTADHLEHARTNRIDRVRLAAPSTKTLQPAAGSPNHQTDSKEIAHV